MVSALTKYYERSKALVTTTQSHALQLKQAGIADSLVPVGMSFPGGDYQAQSQGRENYAMFRSWVYSAVNAIASEAARQPINVSKLKKPKPKEETRQRTRTKAMRHERMQRVKAAAHKAYILNRMPPNVRHKARETELEVITDHPIINILERPIPVQYRYQFVYTFIANLNLTGRAYIIRDEENGEEVYYSLPSTWVRPDHTNGPFSRFYIANPRDMNWKESEPLDASQVAMAYLPNPADPLGALSPATAMSAAIRIDDRIQTCQEKFFENGVFPSVVVTIGKDPHPDVPGGMRPRLTGNQRRQVIGAIRRSMGSVANYGSPAIVDGLIENITRLSATQDEIGWDRSEDKIKNRILSAFCVHPFILGEPVGVGGYAQTYNIKERFADRINVFLDLLSTVMTHLVYHSDLDEKKFERIDGELLIWWEALIPTDPSMDWQNWRFGRQNGDISQNEFRAKLGIAPDEEKPDPVIVPSVAQTVMQVAQFATAGQLQLDQATALLEGLGLPKDVAEELAGTGPKEPAPGTPGAPGAPGGFPFPGDKPPKEEGNMAGQGDKVEAPVNDGESLDDATAALRGAITVMRMPLNITQIADQIVASVSRGTKRD